MHNGGGVCGERAAVFSSSNGGRAGASGLDDGPHGSDVNSIFSYQCGLISDSFDISLTLDLSRGIQRGGDTPLSSRKMQLQSVGLSQNLSGPQRIDGSALRKRPGAFNLLPPMRGKMRHCGIFHQLDADIKCIVCCVTPAGVTLALCLNYLRAKVIITHNDGYCRPSFFSCCSFNSSSGSKSNGPCICVG